MKNIERDYRLLDYEVNGVCGRNILLIISLQLAIAISFVRYCTVFCPNRRMIRSKCRSKNGSCS
jgi:hypothetical protein